MQPCLSLDGRHTPGTVSILTRPQERVQPAALGQDVLHHSVFQSSPAHRSGCNQHIWHRHVGVFLVSILTRPQERVQQAQDLGAYRSCPGCFNPHPPTGAGATFGIAATVYHVVVFQSSPAHRSGCNSSSSALAATWPTCFNPHPPTGAGATPSLVPQPSADSSVSILTRPQERVQLAPLQHGYGQQGVSILTRPQERVQQPLNGSENSPARLFQSSPAHRSGCNKKLSISSMSSAMFQSSPAHRSGCNKKLSISAMTSARFQSSPAHRSGCNVLLCPQHRAGNTGFNPHPPTGAGAT